MTQPNCHRIQRQIVELSLGGGLASPVVQESLAHAFREELVPELTAVFDRVANAHQLLRLDRIEIDLGTIATNDWQPQLRRRLGIELAQELARYTPESMDPGSGVSPNDRPREPLRLFLFFLEHGRIPWWGERPASGWSAFLSGTTLDGPALQRLLHDDTRARVRFSDSVDDERLEHAIERWGGVPHAARALTCLTRRWVRVHARREWRRHFWSQLLDAALDHGALLVRGPELLQELIDLEPDAPARTADAEEPATAVEKPSADDEVLAAGRSEGLPSPWREWLADARRPAAWQPASREQTVGKPDDLPRSQGPAPSPGDTRRPLAASTQADEDAIYLPGAGAILLHPFLETLFRDRWLLEGRDFRDVVAREHAVHLVGLLVFGHRDVPEFDLVAAKLLCGYPLEEPLAPAALEDTDAASCEELLAAVLRHWSVLRSSSADWLRTQFFLRDGKLERVDEGFRLTVERRAQDVLLARLPWGLGVIGFPWMKEKIFVRWLD